MGIFSQFSVARELLQRGELEQALAEVEAKILQLTPVFNLQSGD
jgi:hypothetical protein